MTTEGQSQNAAQVRILVPVAQIIKRILVDQSIKRIKLIAVSIVNVVKKMNVEIQNIANQSTKDVKDVMAVVPCLSVCVKMTLCQTDVVPKLVATKRAVFPKLT